MNDRDYMEVAFAEAEKAAELGEVPVGAIVVYKGEIISAAHNMCEAWQQATAHAEILAIEEACRHQHNWRLSKAVLYVTMEPCPMCCGAILNSRLGRVVFGCHDNNLGAVESVFNILSHPRVPTGIEILGGIMETECQDLLARFFAQRRDK